MSKTSFENLEVYQLAEKLADLTWEIVVKWDHFAKNTVGIQIVNAADSVCANIAEGCGRLISRTMPDLYESPVGRYTKRRIGYEEHISAGCLSMLRLKK